MIITKNTPLDTIQDGDNIYIDKEVSLDSNLLEFLFANYPNSAITISTFDYKLYASNPDALYTEEELQTLVQNAELADKYNRELTFDDDYTLEQAIIASRELNKKADYINNLTIKGSPLSPLEKFAFAYHLVSDKIYSEDKNNVYNSRNIISTLSGDKIVCAGFASELNALCKRIGIPCTFRLNSFGEENKIGNHATCVVNITDEKYGVDGIYVADPTADCLRLKDFFNVNFNHFLLTHDEYNQSMPNNRFDSLIKVNPEEGFVRTPIFDIESLYPSDKENRYIEQGFITPDSHSLDFEKIKRSVKDNISKSFPKDLKAPSKKITPKEQTSIDSTINSLLSFHLEHIVSDGAKEDLPPLVSNYYLFLSQYLNSEELLNKLISSTENISNDAITKAFHEYLEYVQKGFIQSEIYSRLYKDIDKTKPISTETIKKVIKKVLLAVYSHDSRTIEELASRSAQSRENCINKSESEPGQ